jgi:hypothetical protein
MMSSPGLCIPIRKHSSRRSRFPVLVSGTGESLRAAKFQARMRRRLAVLSGRAAHMRWQDAPKKSLLYARSCPITRSRVTCISAFTDEIRSQAKTVGRSLTTPSMTVLVRVPPSVGSPFDGLQL